MHHISIFQVDAFTSSLFGGNPAAVCPLDQWLSDDLMQKIALENNLSETVFFVKNDDQYDIRWFTPTVEVDLCGHATLAAAFVLFHELGHTSDTIHFFSPRSGKLSVNKSNEWLSLNFPTDTIHQLSHFQGLEDCFGYQPIGIWRGKTDLMLIFDSEETVLHLNPNFAKIATLPVRGVITSAPGRNCDFVSRFFGPKCGVNEDPVTGSAHTTLVPYWSKRLNKKELHAKQISARQGELFCKHLNDRVEISGQAKLFLKGQIYLP